MAISDRARSQLVAVVPGPRVWHCALLGLVGTLTLVNSSCGPAGDGLDRIAVVGSVTSASGDLISGTISFLPEAGKKCPAATASIVKGDFKFDKSNGPVAGKYRVLVVGQLGDAKYKGAVLADSQTANAPATTGAPGLPEAVEWTFDADVSPEDFEFDFEVPAS